MVSTFDGATPTRSIVNSRNASVIAITRSASRESPRSTWRNGPVRNGSSLCFVETKRAPRSFAASASVEVGVHEVGVHDVRASSPGDARRSSGVDVAWRRDANRRHAQRVVEVARVPGGIVETDEDGFDAALGQRREQDEEVPLGTADPAHPVNVQHSHAVRSRSQSAIRASVAAASSASRKSHATR